jgi:hypothetical protein
MPDQLTEEAELARLRAEFTGRWVITVDDGVWEALPWVNMREELLVTAPSAELLKTKVLERERK